MKLHIYQQKLNELWDRQPEHLTDIEKLLRIDSLACLEFSDDIQLRQDFNPNWFFYLMLVLIIAYKKTNCLTEQAVVLIKELLTYHAYMYKQETLLNSDPLGRKKRIMQYTVLRKRLRGLINEHIRGTGSVT